MFGLEKNILESSSLFELTRALGQRGYLSSIDDVKKDVALLLLQTLLDRSQVAGGVGKSTIGLDHCERVRSVGVLDEKHLSSVFDGEEVSLFQLFDHIDHELLVERLASLDQRDSELGVDVLELYSSREKRELKREYASSKTTYVPFRETSQMRFQPLVISGS